MSHQSGILPTPELISTFKNAVRSKTIRALKIEIEEESLVCKDEIPVAGDWIKDFQLDHWLTKPCFILYSLDARTIPTPDNHGGWSKGSSIGEAGWLILLFTPDDSSVRSKMLYASSKATLSKELGDWIFVDYIYGTAKDEFNIDGYRKHRIHHNSDSPLTAAERNLANAKKWEGFDISNSIRRNNLGREQNKNAGTLSFPVDDEAIKALETFKTHDANLIVLKIDVDKEMVQLDFFDNISTADDIPPHTGFKISGGLTEPRYILYGFTDKTVFALTCPSSSKIKERTLYASSRASIIAFIDHYLDEDKPTIVKKFELDNPSDFDEKLLRYEFEEKVEKSEKAFSKPAKPGRK
jgi:twinfilin-like protein